MIFLFLTNLLSKETNLTDLYKIIETDKIITPELKTYFKCINSDKMEGVYNIASKVEENVFNKLIYVHNAYYPHTIVRETKELCDLLLPLAKKVSEDYRENRFNFKGKIILSDTKEALEVMNNSDTIIKLALSGEKKGVRIFLNFLEKGIFKVNNHLETLEKLGKMGFALAYGILGEVYLAGHFVKKDYKKAKEYFSLGAKKNEPLSLHGLGMVCFYYEKNINSAKDCFIKAIHKGSVAASYSFYLCNEDVTVSNIIGLSYLSSSASKGYIPAMYKQAELNYNSKRYMDALSYLISICKYSDEIREFTSKAEEYFFKGNLIKSLVYYLVLAETGSYSAIENAVFLIKEKKVIKNDDLLFYLLSKSLKNGVFSYLVEIGDCYFYGKGTSVNYSKAFSYYLSAALNGSFKGIISLSYMYFKGLGCKKNIFKAVKYVWKGMEYESFGYIFVIYFIPFYIFIFLLENIPVKDILLSSFFTVLFILFNRIILSVKSKI